jgi:transcriptional regulator with XRE-family HTH domain
MNGRQIRAARALIGWSAQDLANASSVGVATIRRAELKDRETGMTAPNIAAIRAALEAAGVLFIDENGEGPGVRLKKNAL